jgi:hypothetical protein
MVWTPAQCGAFLDSIEGDRLYPLCHRGRAYTGRQTRRRGQICGFSLQIRRPQ